MRRKRDAIVSLVCLSLLAACATLPQSTVTPPPGMVVVPAGWFWMGEDDERPSNRPRHAVYLAAFAIDRTEVTNEAFAEFVAEAGYQMKGKVVDHVLRGGSWASPPEHAQTFFRDSSHASEPNPRVGFRCVMTWQEGTGNP